MGFRHAMRLASATRELAAATPPPARATGTGWPAPRVAVGDPANLGTLLFPDTGWSVSRHLAMSVPACAEGTTLIAWTVAGLPLYRWKDRYRLEDRTLIEQPDPDLPAVTTYADTLADMVLAGAGYWVVLERATVDGQPGRPLHARHVPFEAVEDDPQLDPNHVRVDGELYARSDVIRFDGPLPGGILTAGAGAIRTAWLWEQAAARYAATPIPALALVNTSGTDLDDQEIAALLDTWESARSTRATAYANGAVDVRTFGWSSAELQLVEARRDADARIGQLLNLPPKYVNAPTASGSQTYATLETSRRDLLDLALSPYMDALAGRLSMNDTTPRGTTVRHDPSGFLRTDLPALVSLGVSAVDAGLITRTEWRRMAGLPDTPSEVAP